MYVTILLFVRHGVRRILGPVYDNEKENWRILTKEIYANIKKPTTTETIRLHRLRWFGHVQRMEENRIPKRVLYMDLETTRPRGRPRNRWLDEVREDGRMVGGEEWQEKAYDREEWKRLLRRARNHHILYMPVDRIYTVHLKSNETILVTNTGIQLICTNLSV